LAATDQRIAALKNELLRLPGTQVTDAVAQEAERIAAKAVVHAKFLAQRYRVNGLPLLHNSLVNMGVKERGLCHHFAHDMRAELATHDMRYFHVIGLAAHPESRMRAHYAIAVGVPGTPFGDHIVLDAWRDSGRLFWARIAEDKRYPWAIWD